MEQISSAAQVIISIIPIVGIVMGSVVIFFYLLWNHRRKTLLIKAGQYARDEFDLLSFSLLAGLLLSCVGEPHIGGGLHVVTGEDAQAP
ncbi:hypothetical protein AGMMS49546_22680 [Spirochaetia bacterium]|nr:hypothetical protein AGMMS49546_22680 [Spirochaetia bacterium]